MVEFDIKIHPKQRLAYIPRQLAKALGTEVVAVPNLSGAYMYPKGTDPKDALRSLDTIRSHLQQKVEQEEKEKLNNGQ